jgi:hypothetical protein
MEAAMAGNGALPNSTLAPIPGSGPFGRPKLRRDAARAYNALHIYSMQRWGISMALNEGDVGRAYRSVSRQQLAKRIYGSNAAVPGTSNHGLGINVDLENRQQRWVIDQIGHQFGFSKKWSDAQWEWWHITFRAADYPKVNSIAGKASGSPTLRKGDSGKAVGNLQWRLRTHGFTDLPRKGEPGRGQFGPKTEKAVKAFQRKAGLTADGVVGQRTWRALRRK